MRQHEDLVEAPVIVREGSKRTERGVRALGEGRDDGRERRGERGHGGRFLLLSSVTIGAVE